MAVQVFWSYRVDDDKGDDGRITSLARNVASEYEALTGDSPEIFLDVDKLKWGDQWRERIDAAVEQAAFFIPVLSPRYFRSANCRDEYTSFVSKARSLGNADRVLPLLYISFSNVASLRSDPLASDLLGVQYKDITRLRWADVGGLEFRTIAHEIASQIIALESQVLVVVGVEDGLVDDFAGQDPSGSGDGRDSSGTGRQNNDVPDGLLDIVSAFENAVPLLLESMEKIARGLVEVGSISESHSGEIGQTQTASARVALLAAISREYEGPALQIEEGSVEFSENVLAMDAGVRAILSWPIDKSDEAEVDARAKFLAEVNDVRDSSSQTFNQLDVFRRTLQSVSGYSKSLAGVFLRIDRSLARFIDTKRIIDGWTSDA